MKHINNFLTEKLKINSNTKVNNIIYDKYYIVVPFGEMYDELYQKYLKSIIQSSHNEDIFLLKKEEILEYEYDDKHEFYIFKIPEKYDSLEEFKKQYRKNKIFIWHDLEPINLNDLE